MLALLDVRLGDLPGEIAHASEVSRALGDAYGAARIEQVERVRAAQDVVVSRNHQPVRQRVLRLGLEKVVHQLEAVHVRDLEVVGAVLDLGLSQQIAIGASPIPVNVPHLLDVLEVHDDAFEAVGVLHRDRI